MSIRTSGQADGLSRSASEGGEARTLVLYDGACPFCRGQMARLRRWDRKEALRLAPFQEPWVAERHPELKAEAMRRAMHVVTADGAVHVGGDAVALLIEQLAQPRVLRYIPKLPGVRWALRWGYPLFADRRRRDGPEPCTGATCAAPLARGDQGADVTAGSDLTPRVQRAALAFSVALILVVLSPVIQNWRDRPEDGFPLSYYPMFSHERGETYRFYHAVGITADGRRVPIAYRRIGSGGLNAVRRQVGEMARNADAEQLQQYTDGIAERVAQSRSRSLRDVVEVRIVRARYNLDDYFLHGRQEPEREEVMSRALVLRSDPAISHDAQGGKRG